MLPVITKEAQCVETKHCYIVLRRLYNWKTCEVFALSSLFCDNQEMRDDYDKIRAYVLYAYVVTWLLKAQNFNFWEV